MSTTNNIELATRPKTIALIAARIYLATFIVCVTIVGVRLTWWLTTIMDPRTPEHKVEEKKEADAERLARIDGEIAAVNSSIALRQAWLATVSDGQAREWYHDSYVSEARRRVNDGLQKDIALKLALTEQRR